MKVTPNKEMKPKRPAGTKTLEQLQLAVKNAVEASKACTVLLVQSRKGDIRIIFRVTDQPAWLRVLASFLASEDRNKWYSMVGEVYKLHNGVLTKAWLLVIDAPDGVALAEAAQDACRALLGAVAVKKEVEGGPIFPENMTIPAAWAPPARVLTRIKPTLLRG